ncbi:lysine transporter LysE [Salipaludibacillus neizhouensis]|uniref:Lysine transporter LysE n=1 Tax=Salipaludibacillus neizhouensis TaxID=885475 RepID=A0A3A9K4E1_9BACI|nr:LysE family transporter [Salipaludibacillus neizhouensis]RKL65740.1 lysine transporter LysE [Salipaludibacillus neizhouensis]
MEAFIHGFTLALGLILPMGVQNLFIFNQGINQPSFYKALPAVITASLCDTLLILIAVLSLSAVAELFETVKSIFIFGGFFFLLFIGWSIWKTPVKNTENSSPATARKQIIFAISVSLLNPHALLDTIGVIGTNSLLYANDSIDKWLFMVATASVSWFYFAILALIGKFIGNKDKSFKFRILFNKISAVTIWILAFYMVLYGI